MVIISYSRMYSFQMYIRCNFDQFDDRNHTTAFFSKYALVWTRTLLYVSQPDTLPSHERFKVFSVFHVFFGVPQTDFH